MENSKRIVVTGGTGLVGRKLCLELFRKGYDLTILSRNPLHAATEMKMPYSFLKWNGVDPLSSEIMESLEGSLAVIHLAGEPLAKHRWNGKVKKAIYDSRILGTRSLTDGLCLIKNKPKVLIGASAIGYYGDRGDEELHEQSPAGNDFLSKVCKDWEAAYSGAIDRTVIIRNGLVLANNGGGLEKMLPAFRFGEGAALGSGRQWMSWIHIDDLTQLIIFSLENAKIRGVINAVAPQPVTNIEFTKTLAECLARPALLRVPKAALKLLFGEMSSVLLASQKVLPQAAETYRFNFKFPTLTEAFRDLLAPQGVAGAYVLETHQWLPLPQKRVFAFFAEAKNLEAITPPWLNFKIIGTSTPDIRQGTLIEYKLRIKGIPIFWRTEIKVWQPEVQFVDHQLKGPYELWDHTHSFETLNKGTLMTDRVIYKIPLGILGDLAGQLMVISDVESIFRYRQNLIEQFVQKQRI